MESHSKRFVSSQAAVTGLFVFVIIGAAQALYGPALPGFTLLFDLPRGSAGLAVSFHNAGALTGLLLAIPLAGSSLLRWRVGGSVLCTTLGALMVGLSPSWMLTLAGVFLIGFGYGALTIGLNSLFAAGFGRHSPAMVNLLNAVFGFGAILGPLIISINPLQPQFAFLVLAAYSMCILPFAAMMDDRIPSVQKGVDKMSSRRLFLAFGCLFSLGIGVEASTIGYTATYLIDAGLSSSNAATATSLFFIAFTSVRLFAIPLSVRFEPAQLVVGSLGLGTILLLLSHHKVIAPYTMVAMGACLGVFFPNCFNWLSRVFGHSSHIVFIISGALLGAIIFPALIALVVSLFGERYIVSALLGLNLLTLIVAGFLWLVPRQKASSVLATK